MQSPSNRSVVIISGLLTLMVLAGATAAVGVRNGWLRAAPEPPAATLNALTTQQNTDQSRGVPGPREAILTTEVGADGDQGEVAAYRAQLEEASRALDEAYAQIRTLQAAQAPSRAGRGRDDDSGEREGERRGRRAHHREADDD